MALEGALIGGAVSVVIELIKALIPITTTAVRCRDECRKLKEKLLSIQPGVEEIGNQLSQLRSYDPNIRLASMDEWLKDLENELHVANITVHKCNSVYTNEKLTKKIMAHHGEITRLAEHRATLNVQLTGLTIMLKRSSDGSSQSHHSAGSSSHNAAGFNNSSSDPDASQHGAAFHHSHADSPSFSSHHAVFKFSSPVHGAFGHHSHGSHDSGNEGSMVRRQRMAEICSILDAEVLTRHPMNLRRHSIASFDFSLPGDQPVEHVQVDGNVAPVHYFDQQQQQYVYMAQQQAGPYFMPQHYAQQGWFHSTSTGHNVHYG